MSELDYYKNRKLYTLVDIIPIIIIIAILIVAIIFLTFPSGNTVKIYSDGVLYGQYSLSKNQQITIENGTNKNIIVIENGKVYMKYSTCKNQNCVLVGEISGQYNEIICAPNKIVIIIENSNDIDAVTGA